MPSNKPGYQKEYGRKHYLANRQYYLDKAKINDKIRIDKTKNFIQRYKQRFGCSQCRVKDHRVLDFHHLRDKIKPVSVMIRLASLKRIKDEIRKCILLCANCHRIHHYEERLEGVIGLEPTFSTPVTISNLEDCLGYTPKF